MNFFKTIKNSITIDFNKCYQTFKKLPPQIQSALSLLAFTNLLPQIQAEETDKLFFKDPTNTSTYELQLKDLPNQNYTIPMLQSVAACSGTVINYIGNASFKLIDTFTGELSQVVPTSGLDFLRMENNPACEKFEKCISDFITNHADDKPNNWMIALGVLLLISIACGVCFKRLEAAEESTEEERRWIMMRRRQGGNAIDSVT
jgi:hypothetical protein